MKGWKNERMKGWKDERMKGWKDERMKEWKNERMKGWKGERMKEWKNERMKGWRVLNNSAKVDQVMIRDDIRHPSIFLPTNRQTNNSRQIDRQSII